MRVRGTIDHGMHQTEAVWIFAVSPDSIRNRRRQGTAGIQGPRSGGPGRKPGERTELTPSKNSPWPKRSWTTCLRSRERSASCGPLPRSPLWPSGCSAPPSPTEAPADSRPVGVALPAPGPACDRNRTSVSTEVDRSDLLGPAYPGLDGRRARRLPVGACGCSAECSSCRGFSCCCDPSRSIRTTRIPNRGETHHRRWIHFRMRGKQTRRSGSSSR